MSSIHPLYLLGEAVPVQQVHHQPEPAAGKKGEEGRLEAVAVVGYSFHLLTSQNPLLFNNEDWSDSFIVGVCPNDGRHASTKGVATKWQTSIDSPFNEEEDASKMTMAWKEGELSEAA